MEFDWRKLVERKDIDLIDVCVPNVLHREIVLAAAAAGKMIVCEKPLAMNAAEAEEMVAAVEKAGVPNMVSFNYRRVPAIALIKQIIDEGRIGRPFHYRAQYNQDYTISADVPQGGMALWRLDARVAGSGVTGDLLAHSIDTALWLNGPIRRVVAHTETFVKERKHAESGKVEPVTIDDACMFLAVFANGSIGTFESTRYARGRKNYSMLELNGENGSVFFNLEDPHLLQFFRYADPGGTRYSGSGQEDRRPPHGLAGDQRHELRAPLHEELVGARLHDRLRAHVHQQLRRLPGGPRGRAEVRTDDAHGPGHAAGLRCGAGKRQTRAVGGNRVNRDLAAEQSLIALPRGAR